MQFSVICRFIDGAKETIFNRNIGSLESLIVMIVSDSNIKVIRRRFIRCPTLHTSPNIISIHARQNVRLNLFPDPTLVFSIEVSPIKRRTTVSLESFGLIASINSQRKCKVAAAVELVQTRGVQLTRGRASSLCRDGDGGKSRNGGMICNGADGFRITDSGC